MVWYDLAYGEGMGGERAYEELADLESLEDIRNLKRSVKRGIGYIKAETEKIRQTEMEIKLAALLESGGAK